MAVTIMRIMPGRTILLNDPDAVKSTMHPLMKVFDAAANTIDLEAAVDPRPFCELLSCDMDTVIASTSTKPEIMLERYTPESPK